MGVQINPERDALLTELGKTTLTDRYLQPGESYQEAFARVATAYGDDPAHAQRMYDYMSSHWFMPATPVLANGGTDKNLPISCYLNSVEDTMGSILDVFHETGWLSCRGGGVGTYWGQVREVGSHVGGKPDAEGVGPWMVIQSSYARAVNQGSTRNASVAFYLDVDHPEIESFIEIRDPKGDPYRKTPQSHHGVLITDKFMNAVMSDSPFDLISRKTGEVVETVSARKLWNKMLAYRLKLGEPFMIFIDSVNRKSSPVYQNLNLKVTQSNLCTEIMLKTGLDHHGDERTAVCCLSSVNAEYFSDWQHHPSFIEDCLRFLDNVLSDFIERAQTHSWFDKAVTAAVRGRDVGLGVMGLHSFMMSVGVPLDSAMSKVWNRRIFDNIKAAGDAANSLLAKERGPCPDAADAGLMMRFTHWSATAPTATISTICGGASPGIEPIPALLWVSKTLSGTTIMKCRQFEKFVEEWFDVNGASLSGEMNREEFEQNVWDYVLNNKGSIQGHPLFKPNEIDVFKTAFELNQLMLVELAIDRTDAICQGQSLNIFIESDVDPKLINQVHIKAYKGGVKSLYYLRSKSRIEAGITETHQSNDVYEEPEECTVCQ